MAAFRTAVLQLLLWLVASGAVIGLIIGRSHYGRRMETSVVQKEAVAAVDRVWFSGDDVVFVASRTPKGINIVRISLPSEGRPERASFHIEGRSDTPYAVSPDGDAIVSSKASEVIVTPLAEGSRIHGPSSRKSEISKVVWIEGNLLLAAHVDGMVDAIDASSLEVRATLDTQFARPADLAGAGTFFAVGSNDRLQIRVYDTRMIPQISLVEHQEVRSPFTSLRLSSAGRIAIGTATGPVIAGSAVPGVGSSAFFELLENQAALIATPSGLLLRDYALGTFPIPNVGSAVTAAAATETRLSVATAGGLVVLSHRITPPIDIVGWTIIYRWLAMSAAVGLFCIVRASFVRSNQSRARASKEQMPHMAHTN